MWFILFRSKWLGTQTHWKIKPCCYCVVIDNDDVVLGAADAGNAVQKETTSAQ